jgi:hypothetical protein
MKRRYHELTCDRCGKKEEFPVNSERIERQARRAGWKVNGKGDDQNHWCSKLCRKIWKQTEARKKATRDAELARELSS